MQTSQLVGKIHLHPSRGKNSLYYLCYNHDKNI